ncbi:hypothetical protein E3E12_08110 [Formicincola oecophyllae]|uniref:Uncharacterized protein n=1 Tax=Formicincola oecophyllae TaxID=2558361 RepID=A0A4Y6U9K7_9PROT|nr:hypothetical protein [Formicincola oecophyllae]QDH14159.1 hypothetical protein E3E12_08110 [Formicincola oecophyllae]
MNLQKPYPFKKLALACFAALSFTALTLPPTAWAQECGAVIYENSGNIIGTISPNGRIYGNSGNIIRTISPNGRIYGNSGNIIGTISPNGRIYENSGNIIGTISPNGRIYENSGNIIGTISPNGRIYENSGNIIGTISPNGPHSLLTNADKMAAIMFFQKQLWPSLNMKL